MPRVADQAAQPAPILLPVLPVSATTTCPMAHAFDVLIPLAGLVAKQTLQSAPHVRMGTSWTQQLFAASPARHTAKSAPQLPSAPFSTPPQATLSSQSIPQPMLPPSVIPAVVLAPVQVPTSAPSVRVAIIFQEGSAPLVPAPVSAPPARNRTHRSAWGATLTPSSTRTPPALAAVSPAPPAPVIIQLVVPLASRGTC